MLMTLARQVCQGLLFRWDALWVPFYLRQSGVRMLGRCFFSGTPVISMAPESHITLEAGGRYLSRSFSTALGVSHPLVLRTLAPGARIHIGKEVGISGGSICAATAITIGDHVLLGADTLIADTDFHPLSAVDRAATTPPASQAVHIESHVFLGARSVVLKGVTIGKGSVIGAGSLVTKSIPPDSLAAGNPCRVIRSLR